MNQAKAGAISVAT